MTDSEKPKGKLGELIDRQHKLFQLVKEGELDADTVLDGLEELLENRFDNEAARKRRLVHEVYTPANEVLAAFKARNHERGWGFSDDAFRKLSRQPAFLDDQEVAVVLFGLLPETEEEDSVQRTFDEYWLWAREQQSSSWVWDEVRSDPDHLRLLKGSPFSQGSLYWIRVKLDTHLGKWPGDIRDPANFAGLEVLAMAGEHPERIKVMGNEGRPLLWIGGLEARVGYDPKDKWERVPILLKGAESVGITFSTEKCASANRSSPVRFK